MWSVPLCDIKTIPCEKLQELIKGTSKYKCKKCFGYKMNKKLSKRKQEVLLDAQLASSANKRMREEINKIEQSDNDAALNNDEKENKKIPCKNEKKQNESTSESEEERQNENNELSEYEKMIKKKREERLAFLETLKIEEVKKEFIIGIKGAHKKRQFKKAPPSPRQKSLRIAQMQNKTNEAPRLPSLFNTHKIETICEPKPTIYPFQDARCPIQDGVFLDEMNISFSPLDPDCKSFSYKNYMQNFRKMKIPSNGIAKVVSRRITSLTIHPTLEKNFIAAGDITGKIGFWDVETQDYQGLYLFDPHDRGVSCLSFSLTNQNQLFSSSYDGNFSCGDIEKKVFTKIYESTNSLCCSYFDFVSPTTFLISQTKGHLVILDARTQGKKIKTHQIHQCNLKTVNVHPDKNHFITAAVDGIVSLWDLRMLKQTSIQDILHKRSATSAFFSPITGNLILTTSLDNQISIFDSANLTEKIHLKQKINHNNCVTRWLTQFKAFWLPNDEETFVVGSMDYPRRIEIYGVNGKVLHHFWDDNLTSITSIHQFHPYKPILIGGNSSGKVFLFKDSKYNFM